MLNISDHISYQDQSLRQALMQLNNLKNLTLFILNNQKQLVGTITDGDVRRALLAGATLEDDIRNVMNPNFKYLKRNNYTLEEIKKLKAAYIKLLPIVDEEFRIQRILDLSEKRSILPVDAIIMAGGKGSRLKPLTDHVPKPLLKVGAKPIIEHNIDRLSEFGIDLFYITINYLGEQLESYFKDGSDKGIQVRYIRESKELGTMGAVTLVPELWHDTVLLMNSDLLTNIDYEELYRFFLEKEADLVVTGIPYHVKIPYAVFDIDGDTIKNFKEKPTYTYFSNGGIYMLKKSLLDEIPHNQHYNATDFMEHLINTGRKVIYYPFMGYWLDIGKHDDYEKAQEDIKYLNF